MLLHGVACHPFLSAMVWWVCIFLAWKLYCCTLSSMLIGSMKSRGINLIKKEHTSVRRVELQVIGLSYMLFRLLNGIPWCRLLQTLSAKRNTALHLWEKKPWNCGQWCHNNDEPEQRSLSHRRQRSRFPEQVRYYNCRYSQKKSIIKLIFHWEQISLHVYLPPILKCPVFQEILIQLHYEVSYYGFNCMHTQFLVWYAT